MSIVIQESETGRTLGYLRSEVRKKSEQEKDLHNIREYRYGKYALYSKEASLKTK
ncbi:hypothetical protein [Halobacillus karajensis]|uniref:hypothetical protein n=1 Tax=Halobacillus karajensis TaxID=195088 RepID=UPI00045CD879|nr:hypothetical protein [Halobacillus karajensis]CDQ21690.1 hypothetical protein BN982_04099 [Halobacillus karajensis]